MKKIYVILIFVGVVALWGLNFLFLKNYSDKGIYGDMFGAVNALFSGLAFGGLIVTLFLQRKELALQRKEIALQKEELKAQRKEFETMNSHLEKQDFMNHFFQLLSLTNKAHDDISVYMPYRQETKYGLALFEILATKDYNNWTYDDKQKFSRWVKLFMTTLGYIDEHCTKEKEAKKYASILQASYTHIHIGILFNLLREPENKEYIELGEKYLHDN